MKTIYQFLDKNTPSTCRVLQDVFFFKKKKSQLTTPKTPLMDNCVWHSCVLSAAVSMLLLKHVEAFRKVLKVLYKTVFS